MMDQSFAARRAAPRLTVGEVLTPSTLLFTVLALVLFAVQILTGVFAAGVLAGLSAIVASTLFTVSGLRTDPASTATE